MLCFHFSCFNCLGLSYVYVLFVCMYGFDQLVCAVPIEARRQPRVLRTGVTDHCEPLCACRELSLCPLEEQPELLTSALSGLSSLQSVFFVHLSCGCFLCSVHVQVPPSFELLVFLLLNFKKSLHILKAFQ